MFLPVTRIISSVTLRDMQAINIYLKDVE